jgi:hypothetical protein
MARRRRRPNRLPLIGAAVAVLVAAVVLMFAQPWSTTASVPTAGSVGSTGSTGSRAASPDAGLTTAVSSTQPSPSAASASASARARAGASPSATPSASRSASTQASASRPATVAAPAGFRTFTLVNDVQQTIWVGAGEQTPQPALTTTGWVLPVGHSLTITVPDKWNGRIWGRTDCSFNSVGDGHCETGDCAGKFQCAQYGVIPATLAEFNLNSWDNLDFYDVSMVDGSNLPMYINIAKGATKDPISSTGCSAAGCTRPVVCPAALVVDGGAGCESACGVFGTDQYCCRGQWAPRSECVPANWPVDYAAVFKTAEPFAYSYVDDDATSTFTCSGECDYRITFGITP